MSEANTVFVGSKPVMNYVLACITLFTGGAEEVCLKARGRAVSRAVDVAEILRRSFLKDLKVKNITIGTEQLRFKEEKGDTLRNVSTIEITLAR